MDIFDRVESSKGDIFDKVTEGGKFYKIDWSKEIPAQPQPVSELKAHAIAALTTPVEMFKKEVPFAKYLFREGQEEFRSLREYNERINQLYKQGVIPKLPVSMSEKEKKEFYAKYPPPGESPVSEVYKGLEYAVFPELLKSAGATARAILPKAVTKFVTTPVSKLIPRKKIPKSVTQVTKYGEEFVEPVEAENLPRATMTAPETIPTVEKPPLPAGKLRYQAEILELRDLVVRGEAGGRMPTESGEWMGYGSSYPPFMRNKGWSKGEVLNSIDKGLADQSLTARQKEIWEATRNEARSIYKSRVAEAKEAKLTDIKTGDLEVGDKVKVKGEVLTVTEKSPEQMTIKDGQEIVLDPYFDTIRGKRVATAAEVPSIESLEAQVKGGMAGPLPKYAEGSAINLEKIDTTDDVKHFLNGLTRTIEKDIGKHPISWEETQKAWLEQGLDAEALKKLWREKGAFTAAEIDAVRQTNTNAISQLHEAIRNLPIDRTQWNPGIRAQLLDTLDLVKVTSQAASEAGRALNIHKRVLRNDPELMGTERFNKTLNVLAKKGINRTDDILETLRTIDFNDPAKVNQFVRNVTTTPWQKITDTAYEIWINGILSGPQTHIVNTVSNALTLAESYPEALLSSGIDLLRSTLTKTPRERFAGEVSEQIFATGKGLFDASRRFINVMKAGGEITSKFEERPSAIPVTLRRFAPTTALSAEDAFFKGFIESEALSGYAYRKAIQEGWKGEAFKSRVTHLLTNPPADLLEQAAQKAKILTYQEQVGKIGNLIMKLRDDVPGLKYFIPFVRTPLNIARFSLERTPLNIPRIILKAGRGELKGGELSDEAAKVLMGSLMGTSAYLLASGGIIQGGGPKERAKRDELLNTGWLPYSIRIGDTFISYGRLEPLGSIIGLAADFRELQEHMSQDEKMNIAAQIAASISKNITSKTFVQGFTGLMDAISDPGKFSEKAVQNLIGSVVPSALAGTTRAIDPYYRKAKTLLDTIKARIPVLSEQVAPRMNIWGESIERPGAGITRIFSPVQVSEVKGTPIDFELARLKLDLGLPSNKIDGMEIPENKYRQMVFDAMQGAKQRLNALLTTDSYQAMEDKEKERAIKRIVSNARDREREFLRRELNSIGRMP